MLHDDDLGDTPELLHVCTRRSNKLIKPSSKYPFDEYVTLTGGRELEYFEEALESEEKQKWLDLMQDEMKSLYDSHTYDSEKLPKDKRALENIWILKVKQETSSTSPRYKAILVVKSFRQRKGVDFNKIFLLVVKMSFIKTMLSLVVTLDLDVK